MEKFRHIRGDLFLLVPSFLQLNQNLKTDHLISIEEMMYPPWDYRISLNKVRGH